MIDIISGLIKEILICLGEINNVISIEILLNFIYCSIFMLYEDGRPHSRRVDSEDLERNLKFRFNDLVNAFTLLEELPIDVYKRILVPDSFSLNFRIQNGPEKPVYFSNDDLRKANGARFRDECIEIGIIPDSYLEIEAGSPDFVFTPGKFSIHTPETKDEDYQRTESMKLIMALLNGGVPYGVGINVSGHLFERFRNDLLPRLKKTYEIHSGVIAYTTHGEGPLPGSSLSIRPGEVILKLEDDFDDASAYPLVEWFRSLELKAGGQIELLRD